MNLQLEKKKKDYGTYPGTSLEPLPHFHNHLELILMKTGKSRAIAGNKEVLFEDGDLFISFPNQIHFYLDIVVPQEHQVVFLLPEILPEFDYEFKNCIPCSPILKNAASNPKIVSSFENIVKLLKNQDQKYASSELKGNTLIFFSELFRCMPLEQFVPNDSLLLENVIYYCQANYMKDITLQSISKALCTNQFYISRLFNEQLYISFRDYINSLRIEKACALLKTNQHSITEIAYAVGYNSLRTFHRCFLKIEGMTPKEYIKKHID